MHAPTASAEGTPASDYPPVKTGLRGDEANVYKFAHALRDGKKWDSLATPEESGETYDLVVVGAGISGLAAAYFYRNDSARDPRFSYSTAMTILAGTRGAMNLTWMDGFCLRTAARSLSRAREHIAKLRRGCSRNSA